MEAVEQPQQAEELRLLLEWDTKDDHRRYLRAGELSVAIHAVAIIALLLLPREAYRPRPVARHITPLIAPPSEITQREPNRAKISKEFNIQALLPRPRIQIPPPPPPTTRPQAPRPPRRAPPAPAAQSPRARHAGAESGRARGSARTAED